ncbi:deoxyribodipyrimidine photo-lyase-like [Prorops nasuta]|uniref:deoxyribodipyrimidine photo-lyase-like n=1 Tax=Prorops nasuta TaxID=863751 RepID=UPI0034CDA674
MSTTIKKLKKCNLILEIEKERLMTAESIMHFNYNKRRVQLLKDLNNVQDDCKGILYWMFRDARVQDNWAFLFAQKIAIKHQVPLHVCFCILPKFLESTLRHYKFLIKGLKEVEAECKELNINFHLLQGEPNTVILQFVQKYNMGAVITDFFPLKIPLFWVNDLKEKLPRDIPICQVDAHNIVPCWIASDKLEYSARTIRNKINKKLDEYLTQFPPVIKHPYTTSQKIKGNNWKSALKNVEVDKTVDEVEWAIPGYTASVLQLENFINNSLKDYHSEKNNPVTEATSNLSPWFHFGMISVQRCILEVQKYKNIYKESVNDFLEEAIIRRELSDNYCFYNEHYDTMKGASKWAFETLDRHRNDKREYVYNLKEIEHSLTHDDLWNACQNQLVRQGKMHGYLRMYWAKKILEWTSQPEEALAWTIYLNDKYSMDGNDPNGYVGCMWSICGTHDQGWKERNIFGKIRYMNYKGCERKFNVKEFVNRWEGKINNVASDKI